jgi:hypothetical protein
MPRWFEAIRTVVGIVLRGYAGILLAEGEGTGACVLVASAWHPLPSLAGLASALLSAGLAQAIGISPGLAVLCACNGALAGLFLGVMKGISWTLMPTLLGATLLCVAVASILADRLWSWGHLPALSLPFVAVVAWISGVGVAPPASMPILNGASHLPPAADGFLQALSGVVCAHHAIPGAVLFAALLLRSRLLALFALGGYALGVRIGGASLLAFNYPLTAMALGGVFIAPSWISGLAASSGIVIAAHLLGRAPILALPFGIATLVVLALLRLRVQGKRLPMALESPDLPERHVERRRLAQARCFEVESVPLAAPFYGEWRIYQGFNGPHTHRDQWRHALDFFVHDGRASHRGSGAEVSDYLAFGLPVLSPCEGVVVDCCGELPDNAAGRIDTDRNWGNFVMIRMASGLCVLLAHLQQHSLKVALGSSVAAGQVLGACGNSGRSPQPHIHLHVQQGPRLGDPTHPFHLVSVQTRTQDRDAAFHLQARPAEGEWVSALLGGGALENAFQWPPQRQLVYHVKSPGAAGSLLRTLEVEITLEGQCRLKSDRGASAAFEVTGAVFATYDRQGPEDPFFDLWLLTFGFTPLSPQAQTWSDRPAARQLPDSWMRRGLAQALGLDLAGLRSEYVRTLTPDGRFHQQGRHRALLGLRASVRTSGHLSSAGPLALEAASSRGTWSAQLVAHVQEAWESSLDPSLQEATA